MGALATLLIKCFRRRIYPHNIIMKVQDESYTKSNMYKYALFISKNTTTENNEGFSLQKKKCITNFLLC